MRRILFIGRFQPFHNGHYMAMKELLRKYDEIVIVLGSANEAFTHENPFTVGERVEMIRSTLSKKELTKVILIPVPDVNDNSIWVDHVLSYVPAVNDVYSNNQLVKMLFSRHGILVKSTKVYERERYQGRKIRDLMLTDDQKSWRRFVPKAVFDYLGYIEAEKRIKKIAKTR